MIMKIKNKSTKNIKKYKSLSNEQLGEIIGGGSRSPSIFEKLCNWIGMCNNKDMRKQCSLIYWD